MAGYVLLSAGHSKKKHVDIVRVNSKLEVTEMICSKCGKEIADTAKFCKFCGAKAEPAMPKKRFCRECGAALKENAKFCTKCGTKVAEDIEPKKSEKQKPEEPKAIKPKAERPKIEASTPTEPKGKKPKNEAPKPVEFKTEPSVVRKPAMKMGVLPKKPMRKSKMMLPGEMDFGEVDLFGDEMQSISNPASQDTAGLSSMQVRALIPGIFHGAGSYLRGILRIFKYPKALFGTILLAVIWFVLGNLQNSEEGIIKFLSWITYAKGGAGRNTVGVIGGILGKGMVATGLLSVFNGGLAKAAKGLKAFFGGHNEKRGIFSIVLGVLLGLAIFLGLVGLSASAEASIVGIAGALCSLEALGSQNGKLYELAQSFTSEKSDGVRVASVGKCDGILTGLIYGFILGAVIISLA